MCWYLLQFDQFLGKANGLRQVCCHRLGRRAGAPNRPGHHHTLACHTCRYLAILGTPVSYSCLPYLTARLRNATAERNICARRVVATIWTRFAAFWKPSSKMQSLSTFFIISHFPNFASSSHPHLILLKIYQETSAKMFFFVFSWFQNFLLKSITF